MITCAFQGCPKSPSFNYINDKPKYCKKHKLFNMVNIKNIRYKIYRKMMANHLKYQDILNYSITSNYIINIDNDIKYILNLKLPVIRIKTEYS